MAVAVSPVFSEAAKKMQMQSGSGAVTTASDRLPTSATPSTTLHVDPTTAQNDPKATQADITRAIFEDHQARFVPVENAVIGEATASIEPEARRAGATAGSAFDRTRGTYRRNISRIGLGTTPEQNNSLARSDAIEKTKAIANATNSTRRSLTERNTQAKADMIGIGQGIATTAAQNLDTAAGLQTARQALAEQQQAASKASKTGGAIAGASAGAAYGPWGAVAGGVIGYLAG